MIAFSQKIFLALPNVGPPSGRPSAFQDSGLSGSFTTRRKRCGG